MQSSPPATRRPAAVIEDGRKHAVERCRHADRDARAFTAASCRRSLRAATCEAVVRVTEQALADRRSMDQHEVDAVAATCAPGLIGALLVGANFAQGRARSAMDKPLIPVHHIRGHIAATYLAYPRAWSRRSLTLVASGGHSEIVDGARTIPMFRDPRRHARRRGGRGVRQGGARARASRYPGGPKIDALAQKGDPKRYKLPDSRIVEDAAATICRFSGLKTAVINLVAQRRAEGRDARPGGPCGLVLHGGRAIRSVPRARGRRCIRRTRAMWSARAASRRIRACAQRTQRQWRSARITRLFLPPLKLCGDNAAMIGAQAYYEYLAGNLGHTLQNAYPTADIGRNICDPA